MKQIILYMDKNGSCKQDILEWPNNAIIENDCVVYHNNWSIHSKYKVYKLDFGETVEFILKEDEAWED